MKLPRLSLVTCYLSFLTVWSCRDSDEDVGLSEGASSLTTTDRSRIVEKRAQDGPDLERSPTDFIRANAAVSPKETWEALGKLASNGRELGELRDDFVAELTKGLGLDVALETIVELTGEGAIRRECIAGAFANAREGTDVILQLLEKLDGREQRLAALEGLSFKNLDLGAFEYLSSMSDECAELYLRRLSIAVGTSETREDQAEQSLSLIKKRIDSGSLPQDFHNRFLELISIDSPFVAWKLANQAGPVGFEPSSALLLDIVRNMATCDPLATLELTGAYGGESRGKYAREAFAVWLSRDASASMDWYANANLTSAESSAVAVVLAERSAADGDFSQAWTMLDQIEDQALRESTEGRVWQAERNTLRSEVNRKPFETVQAIVDGDSRFESYWLEEAVHTWVSKDFDSANAWYQENWNSLPKEKAQYVAAGFATQAIGQGDVETARQWAGMIQDAKTRDRIEGAIAKAAGE